MRNVSVVKAINWGANEFQLTSLFSSTADILFMYKDMETSVSSPVTKEPNQKHAATTFSLSLRFLFFAKSGANI
jgi:hypothetical protein